MRAAATKITAIVDLNEKCIVVMNRRDGLRVKVI